MLTQPTFQIATTSSAVQDPDVRALLTHCQPGAVTFYPTDAMIYAQGDAAGPLYLVEFGTVRICRLTSDGRRQITSFCYAGDVFGLEDGDEHQSYAESVDGAGLRVLRSTDAGNFAQRLLSLALRRFARVQKHLLLLGRMSANERMAQFLVDLLEQQESDDIVNLPMQRNDIADYLGLTIETVSRTLTQLENSAAIAVPTSRRIVLRNRAALTRLNA